MGIRFRCHHCEAEMNLKNFQAGKRGRCPECSGRFRVPNQSTDYSLPLEDVEDISAVEGIRSAIGALSQARGATAATVQMAAVSPVVPESSAVPAKASVAGSPTTPDHGAAGGYAGSLGRSAAGAAKSASGKASVPSQAREAVRDPSKPAPVPTSPEDKLEPRRKSAENTSENFPPPAAVAEAPTAVWYVRPPTGGQFGPADGKVFCQWLAEGRVAPEAYVWRDGWPDWQPASVGLADFFAQRNASLGDASLEVTSRDVVALGVASHTEAPIPAAAAVLPDSPVVPVSPVVAVQTLPAVVEVPLGAPVLTAAAGVITDPRGTLSDSATAPRPTSGTATLIRKRRQTRNRCAVGIGILAVIALVLIATLVVVLVRS